VKRPSILCAAGTVFANILFATTAVRGDAPIEPRPFGGVFVPSDAHSDCALSSSTFAAWFQTRRVTANGFVDPANGLAFPANSNSPCDFYEWAQRMFLWATSPVPAYAAAARNFESNEFFDVSPPDSHGNMALIAHAPGKLRFFPLRSAKPDAKGLQIITSRSGELLEVEPNQMGPHKLPLVQNGAGAQIEVQRIKVGANGGVDFYDSTGSVIANPRMIPAAPRPIPISIGAEHTDDKTAEPPSQLVKPIPVQEFDVDGVPVYVDATGNVVPVEPGQADNGVLEAQTGSLVYYAIMVNDVYAYFLTGQKTEAFLATQFPTTQGNLDAVTTLAGGHNVKIAHPEALAVELKTSWVDAASLADPNDYITTTASVPTYNTSDIANWTPTGTKTVTLALVGMHVVGSVAGHPDMVWSTFEHVNNAPNAAYSYTSKSGIKTLEQATKGSWLFCCSNADGPFNQAHMSQVGTHIESNRGFTISPSDTIRWKPWGAASNLDPGTKSTADSNAEIISLDSAVVGMLSSADLRSKYILIGATWTQGGGGPTGDYPKGNIAGTNQLSNTTLETYVQGSNTTSSGGAGCFACHNASSFDLLAMSHIFPFAKPLWGKSVDATPESVSLKPAHTLTQFQWNITPATCAGTNLSAAEFFESADAHINSQYTALFPFLRAEPNPSGSMSASGLYEGNATAVIYYDVGTEDQYTGACGLALRNSQLTTFQSSGAVNARSGFIFDLKKLSQHTIYSATLTITPVKTLSVWNTPVSQTAPCGLQGITGPGQPPQQNLVESGPYFNRPCTVAGIGGSGVTSGFGGAGGYGGGNASSSTPISITYPVNQGAAQLGKGGWCWLVVATANREWLNHAEDLTYAKNDVLIKALNSPKKGSSNYGSSASGQASLAIDVTKIVQTWVSNDDSGDNGFILANPVSSSLQVLTSAGCMTEFDPTLQVVYFK